MPSVYIFLIKYLNEANPSLFPTVKILHYTKQNLNACVLLCVP